MYNNKIIQAEIRELETCTKDQIQSLKTYLTKFSENDFYNFAERVTKREVDGFPMNHLAYAYHSFRMLSVQNLDGFDELVTRAIKIITLHFLSNYVTIRYENELIERAGQLKNLILREFTHRMSLFGLIHAFYLLSKQEHPCDVRMKYGYDGQGITQALNAYIRESRKQYEELMKKVELKRKYEQPAKEPARIDDERFREFQEKMDRLSSNYELDMDKQREFSRRVAAGDVDINQEIESYDNDHIPFD